MSGSSEDGEIGLGIKQEVNGRDDDSEVIRNENGFVHSTIDHAAQLKFHYELLVPHELELRSSGAEGVWTKTAIPRGTKYGPYIGKWLQKPIDMRFAWEVHVAERRGYLDGSVEILNWLKFIRTAKHNKKQNIRPVLLAGQVYYETVLKVEASQELLLGSRMPLQMDTNGNSLSLPLPKYEDRSDQESSGKIGGQPASGVNDEEDKDYNDDQLKCFVCDKIFTDIDQLDRHFVTSHDRPADQFPCNHCPKKYSWESCLTQHKLLSHPSYQNFPCENCNKTFSDPSNLQRHIRTHHVGARSHACQVCGKTFATSSGLKQHTHIHSSVKPFRCEVCFKAYTQFSNLCRHKRMHSSCKMQIKCTKCNQSFSTNTSLTKHKRFCDSTPSASLPPQVPLPNMSYMHPQLSCNTNPYLNYPRPSNALPLYPPLLTHYQPIFSNAAAAAAAGHMPPQFLANSLLFGQPPSKMFNEEKPAPSPLFLHEMQKQHRRKSHTPSDSELNHSFRVNDVKEESRSPVDVKPSLNGDKMAMNGENPLKRPLEECNEMSVRSPKKIALVNLKTEMPVKRAKSEPSGQEAEKQLPPKSAKFEPRDKEADEPLDLSTKKEVEESADDQSRCSDKEDSEDEMVDGSNGSNGSDDDTSSEVNVAESTTDSKESPPRPNQDLPRVPTPPLPPTSKPTDSAMAYPRPIHPFLLDNFYRHNMPNFAPHINSFGGRQLPLPSLSSRINFLGQLMNGLQNGPSLNNSFEQLLRPPFVPFNNNTKPFPELPHVATAAKNKDRYTCTFCGKVFPRSANLTRHTRTHTGEQPYKCKYCERSFSISSNLQRHVRNIHNKEKPFKCSLCDRCFGQQTNLDRHLRKHEAGDAGGIASTADSPESANEAEPDAYFDEIRSFMGKVGYPGGKFGSPPNVYKAEDMSSIINPDEESEEDEDDLSDEVASHNTSSQYQEDSKTLIQSPSPISLCLNSKMESNGNMMNNNSQEAIPTNI